MSTALILHPKATPKPVTVIHAQSRFIEAGGPGHPCNAINLQPGNFLPLMSFDTWLRARALLKPHRRPEEKDPSIIDEQSVARALRLVKTLRSDCPRVRQILAEITWRLRVAHPYALDEY